MSQTYLIFISSDGRREGYEIFNFNNNLWPIYKKTPQLINIEKDKKFIFNSGTNTLCQNFVASTSIKEIIDLKSISSDPNQEFRQVLFNVRFNEINYFQKPVNIKNHINNLSFIEEEKKRYYGLYLQGGVCKINEQTYEYIINKSSENLKLFVEILIST